MSITRRLLNLARANINALLDKVGESEGSVLEDLSDEELEAELLRRRARREREEELRRIREEAERVSAGVGYEGAAPRGSRTQGRPSEGGGSAAGDSLAEYYAQLEVPVGADFSEVRAAYRRLMRKYHPDRFENDPSKAATATELTKKLSHAYREIEKAVRPGRVPRKRM